MGAAPRVCLAVAGLCGVALLGAAPAHAWKPLTPQRPIWPGNPARITYFNQTNHDWAVEKAVNAWNRSGADLRFVEAASAQNAKVLIRFRPANAPYPPSPITSGWCQGAAIAHWRAGANGQMTGATIHMSRYINPTAWRCRFESALVVAHELGHVLGLGHEDGRCALMNTVLASRSPAQCPPNDPDKWRCRVVERDDQNGVLALYGGVAKPLRTPAFCDAAPTLYPTAARASASVTLAGDVRSPEP